MGAAHGFREATAGLRDSAKVRLAGISARHCEAPDRSDAEAPFEGGCAYTIGMRDAKIVARNLRQGHGRQPVIDGLDIDLPAGVFGLLGPNGAGKTTLLRTLATETGPQGGTLQLLGRSPSDARQLKEIRRRLGFLPQKLGYFPGFTVREFIEYSAWLREVPKPEMTARVEKAIAAVDLAGASSKKLKHLSGGMRRRAGIACAIVNDPEILILDEPTSGLDPEQRATFRRLLRDYGATGVVVVATHLVEDVTSACTDVAVMRGGRFVFRGSPKELADAGSRDALGDSAIERGYTTILAGNRTYEHP